jgi:hypothetical protein
VLLIASAFLIYSVSLLPDYNPYHLNEQFNGLDPNVWNIGGAMNYTVSDGELNLFGSTSATHYFVTAPKWQGAEDTPLQGSIKINFKVTAPTDRSVVVVTTDSWFVYVRNGSLVVATTDRPGRGLIRGGVLDSGWHRLMADSEANSLRMSIDGTNLLSMNDWSGNLTLIVLGTAEQAVDGLSVQGTLSVNSVTAELMPLVEVTQPQQPRPHQVDSFAGASIDTMASSGKFVAASRQYLSVPISSNWQFGSENFTIDFWARFNSLPAAGVYYTFVGQATSGVYWQLVVYNYPSGTYNLQLSSSSGGGIGPVAIRIAPGTWYHFAVVRSSSTGYLFINGTLALSGSISGSLPTLASPLYIGYTPYNNEFFDGWIDEFRISKGIARWTSGFTPPSTAYSVKGVPDNYTVLLLEFVGGFGDSSPVQNTVMAHNGASIDASQYVFSKVILGTGAGKFVAASDEFLTVTNSADWNFGSGNFTIDFWVRFTSLPSNGNAMEFLMQEQDTDNRWQMYVYDSSGTYSLHFDWVTSGSSFGPNGVDFSSLSTATWYHIAIARSGNTFYYFLDGSELGTSQSYSTAIGTYSGTLYIGEAGTYSEYYLDGWLKEVRVSKGIARWTSNFTPPSAEYTADQYTVLLLHMDSTTFADSSIGYWTDTTAAQVDDSPFTVLPASTDRMYFGFMNPPKLINFLLV